MSGEKRGLRHGKTLEGFCSNPNINIYGRGARMENFWMRDYSTEKWREEKYFWHFKDELKEGRLDGHQFGNESKWIEKCYRWFNQYYWATGWAFAHVLPLWSILLAPK